MVILFNKKGQRGKEHVRQGIKFYFHLKFKVLRYPCGDTVLNMPRLELRREVQTVSSFLHSFRNIYSALTTGDVVLNKTDIVSALMELTF